MSPGAVMPNHSLFYILAVISLPLSGVVFAADDIDAGYPAPPGVYGQDTLLNNTHLNLGKGSPYIILENSQNQASENQAQDATDQQPVVRPEKSPPAAAKPETPIYQPAKITAPSAARPVAVEPDKNAFYPEAEEMRQQYLRAESLSFDQWGHETVEYGDPSVPINSSPNWQTYPDRQAQRINQPYKNRGNMTGGSNISTYPGLTEPGYINPGYTMHQFFYTPKNTEWMPPSNPYLAPFEQFPVPQNPYGFSSATSSVPGAGLPAGTNLQYLPKIPQEDIIYPPSYPGKRPGN